MFPITHEEQQRARLPKLNFLSFSLLLCIDGVESSRMMLRKRESARYAAWTMQGSARDAHDEAQRGVERRLRARGAPNLSVAVLRSRAPLGS